MMGAQVADNNSVDDELNNNLDRVITTTNEAITKSSGAITSQCSFRRKQQQTSNDISFVKELNLKTFDGFRCIVCFCVILFHVHYFNGGALLLRDSPCMISITNFPFVGYYLVQRTTFHMTLFWIISGFLCEYQLHQMLLKGEQAVNKQHEQAQCVSMQGSGLSSNHAALFVTTDEKTIGWREYGVFFLNRLLRLYPLYILLQIMAFIHSIRINDTGLAAYTVRDLVLTLFFIKKWTEDNSSFAGVSWSVQVDVHGYVAIILLFALTYKYTYSTEIQKRKTWIKKYIIVSWYVLSLINALSCRTLPRQRLSGESLKSLKRHGALGIDVSSDEQLATYGFSTHGTRQELYPEFDFDNEISDAVRQFRSALANETYFTSIFKHGSAALLGSLLYLNLYERNGRPSHPGRKVLLSMLSLFITQGWHFLSGLSMYFLLDAILTFKPVTERIHDTTRNLHKKVAYKSLLSVLFDWATTTVVKFLSMPIFKRISPYTYGIYLFHMICLGKRAQYALPSRMNTIKIGAKIGIDACSALADAGFKYNLGFLFREATIIFIVGLVYAVFVHRVIEQPIMWVRKQWLPKFMSSSSTICFTMTRKIKKTIGDSQISFPYFSSCIRLIVGMHLLNVVTNNKDSIIFRKFHVTEVIEKPVERSYSNNEKI